MRLAFTAAAALGFVIPRVAGHISIWHSSMWGFNYSNPVGTPIVDDNRPVAPLMNRTFSQWWFHGHLDYPPNDGDIFELPAGQTATTELACTKAATSWADAEDGGDIRIPGDPNNPCPGSPVVQFHTQNITDVKGCALAITYNSDVASIKPEDFTVFSVNQTCVWNRFTDFQVPEKMPACPPGGCTCAWFWIHSPDAGSEQNYMNGFKCNVTSATSTVPLAKPQVARRCGSDPLATPSRPDATPGNCTYGAKQPLYWDQAEQNNMFEGVFSPPFYNDLYNFLDGDQWDIFEDSYTSMPTPGPNQTAMPVLSQTSVTGSGSNNNTSTPIPAASKPTTASSAGEPGASASATRASQSQCSMSPSSTAHLSKRHMRYSSSPLLGRGMLGRSRRLNPSKRSSVWWPL